MRNEQSEREASSPACLFLQLFVCISNTVFSVLLFVLVTSWFSVLWTVAAMPVVCNDNAPMFSSTTISLTWHSISFFRPRLFTSLEDSMYTPSVYLSRMDCETFADDLTQHILIPQFREYRFQITALGCDFTELHYMEAFQVCVLNKVFDIFSLL